MTNLAEKLPEPTLAPEGSSYTVPLTKITDIKEHPNADRLEIAMVYGYCVVAQKGKYKIGDEVIYIPIDSVLPEALEYRIFPEDSKIKLTKGRIKQIRIRKIASQGMLISPEDVKAVFNFTPNKLEKDYKDKLQVTKYEPPAPKFQSSMGGGGGRKTKKSENSSFHKYNGLTHLAASPFTFKEGEMVVFQEKIHGTNARAGLMPFEADTILKKIKKFFGLTPKFEFCYGSNNVQLQNKRDFKGYYGEDVYGRVFKELNIRFKLKEGESIFGEIYGEGIQKNYNYGLKEEQKFALFDVKVTENGRQRWLDPEEVIAFGKERGIPVVPELYRGPYVSIDQAKAFTLGPSVMNKKQQVREGIVVKTLVGYSDERGSKRALKLISEKYLDKDQSDFH